MNKEKFEELLTENFKEEYGDKKIFSKNGLYDLAYTTSEDEKNEYQLRYDFHKKQLLWFINNKVVAKESYSPEDIVDSNLFDLLFENCYEYND